MQNLCCVNSLVGRHCRQVEIDFEGPLIFVNAITTFAKIIVQVDHLVRGNGLGYALYINMSALLTTDLLFDKSVSLIRNKNPTRWSYLFEPGCEIYTAADNGVVHPVLATEIPDGAETSINSNSTAWRFFNSRGSPHALQFTHSLPHGDRHLYACCCIRLNSFGIWVAEEDEDGVSDVLVDCPTKLQSDLRHLGEIMVEKLGQILGFQPFSRLGEAFEVRKKDR